MANLDWVKTIAERKASQLESFGAALEATEDDFDFAGSLADSAESDLLGSTWRFSYRNASGDRSEREVTIRSISLSKNGALAVSGFCHLRRTIRAFRCDRIAEMINVKTGEIVDDVTSFMAGTSDVRGAAAPAGDGTREVLARCRDGLRALLFLAWSDGELHEDEIEAMLGYADRRGGRMDYDIEKIRAFICAQDPDAELFTRGLKRISSSPDHLREFMRSVEKVLVADGGITAEETVGVIELREALDRNDEDAAAAFARTADVLVYSFNLDDPGVVAGRR